MDLVVAIEEDANGFGVGDVLLFKYAFGESMVVIGGKDGDGSLDDDCAVVKVLVDKVDRAAGDLYAVVESLLLSVKAGKGRKQGWMDIKDALRELLHEPGESRRMYPARTTRSTWADLSAATTS